MDFLQYLNKLEACAHRKINDANDLIQVLEDRVDYFDKNGCRLSDFGLAEIFTQDYTPEEVDVILKKRVKGSEISSEEAGKYASFIQYNLSKLYHAKQWTQQFHLGAIRNNNPFLLKQVGADSGCDSIGDISHAQSMSRFFGRLENEGILAKTITYNLNPAQSEVFATMMGNFSEAGVPGKMQWGSAWWFLDQKDGMENQLNILSNMGLLSRFIGMLTDSRSFLSFPRHEYFRRILCNLLAEDMNRGLLPDDFDFIGSMIQDICYKNAKAYFDFK
jgi:glucuronate isomerase